METIKSYQTKGSCRIQLTRDLVYTDVNGVWQETYRYYVYKNRRKVHTALEASDCLVYFANLVKDDILQLSYLT